MKHPLIALTFAALAITLPLVGAHLTGHAIEPYLGLPATSDRRSAASFEWPAFLTHALIILAVIGLLAWRIVVVRPIGPADTRRWPYPWWGWVGVALTTVAWVVAWTRLPWLAPLQVYTFTPLWLGYILVINALTVRGTGHCLLLDRPGCFLALFPASAAFWWYFEYLNRFVGNWHYLGIQPIAPFEYVVHASVSFSTVLPAVVSTRDWLASRPRTRAAFAGFWPVRPAARKTTAGLLLIAGAGGFLLVGAWPQHFYSMVWLAPLLVLTALPTLLGLPGLGAEIARGDWRNIALPALAALVCGFFWEMWNWHSMAHWVYTIPFVHRFLLFEMPILGYAGYLPFGIVCAMVGDLICGTGGRSGRPAA